ncbi:hypothetical protein [Candidatus Poriferisodalis sp.]|uniref:hypothetical protein n=1 Tax=Candidatus Poriferisodalis sp. TaxID=3101277 RepID=UPI003B02CD5C
MLNRFGDYPIRQTLESFARPATSDPCFYDRMWFNGYADDAGQYFGLGMAVCPHRGILDCHFSVTWAGGLLHCFCASRRAPAERIELSVGPFRLEIVEPLRQARVILDDNESGVACDFMFSACMSAIAATTLVDRTERGDALFMLMLNRHGRHALDWQALDEVAVRI